MFDNLVKFVYKLGKNWQTRACDPVFKTAGSAPDAAMILGLFSQKKILRLTLIVSYIELFIFILILFVPHQNYEVKQGEQSILLANAKKQNRLKPFVCKFPYKNNNHIFYDYYEINQKGLPVQKT